MFNRKQKGFTIVELLIVIVVIAVLVGITVTAFGGVRKRADIAALQAEALAWKKAFETYKATYGSFPAMASGGYCLGTGFPNGFCRNFPYDSPEYRYSETASVTLMNELNKITTVPQGPRMPVNDTIGPYVVYFSANIVIQQVFPGGANTQCPEGLSYAYDDGGMLICDVSLMK